MTRPSRLYLLLGALGLAAIVAIAAEVLPLRAITVALFLAVGPGIAVTWLAGIREWVARLALVVPISLSIDALIVSVILYLGIWSPELVMGLIVLLTVGAIALAPFERSARAALIAIALLPGIVLVAGELSFGPLT
jgi:hypothetical protein